ncbi:MAG TPA: amidohydrolase family protein [Phycisphaerales bacterium]|nr:amidohydrolase family protein [Phycisphaerales bacterium]
MTPQTAVIDAHCHAGPGAGFSGPWDTDAPLDDYTRRARACGIAHTVIWSAFHDDYAAANERVAKITLADQTRYSGVAFVHAERDRGRIAEMVRGVVLRYGFRGIKCHRHDARITREVCEAARKLRLPIVYDPMGEIEAVELAASQYPDVSFIIPHLGSFADDWKAQRAFLDVFERRANVFTDTSGVRRFDLIVEAVQRGGPAKILFGSDGPWLHPAVELAKITALCLPAWAFRLMTYENARRLFRLRSCLHAAGGRCRCATPGAARAPSAVRAAFAAPVP